MNAKQARLVTNNKIQEKYNLDLIEAKKEFIKIKNGIASNCQKGLSHYCLQVGGMYHDLYENPLLKLIRDFCNEGGFNLKEKRLVGYSGCNFVYTYEIEISW